MMRRQEKQPRSAQSTQRSKKGICSAFSAVALGAAAFIVFTAPFLNAQLGRGTPPGPPQAPRAAAPIDLTGYWVSVVTEDWRFRMMTPPKGDFASVPLNDEGRKVGQAWDPAADEASGNACKSYGAANIMRVPGRLHITWRDDTTLEIDTDAGWQGYSVAQWEFAGATQRGGGGGGAAGAIVSPGATAAARGEAGRGAPARPQGGSLKVVTTHLKAGYLRKNGVPYSENAVVTEYFDRHNETNGDQWFTVTTIVEDPKYLQLPFITSTHFKKEPDGAKWRPTPCSAS